MDGSQASIPGPHAVGSVALEVLQERADQSCVEVRQVKFRGRLRGAPLSEPEKQPERVSIGGHRLRTGLALVGEAFGEEGLQRGRQRTHGSTPNTVSRR